VADAIEQVKVMRPANDGNLRHRLARSSLAESTLHSVTENGALFHCNRPRSKVYPVDWEAIVLLPACFAFVSPDDPGCTVRPGIRRKERPRDHQIL